MFVRNGSSFPILVGVGLALAPACSLQGDTAKTQDPAIVECSNGPDECPKIEGNDIGTDDVTLEVDGMVVTFVAWQEKEGEDGEYIGFTLDRSATFIVKAGDTCYAETGDSWVHPDGVEGPDASGISNIQVCVVDEPEPFCGDAIVNGDEECDDGNTDDEDRKSTRLN